MLGIDFYATYENIVSDQDSLRFNHNAENLGNKKFSEYITCDEQRIKQVLLSIQSNALKFTEEGKVEIKVKILEVEVM